MTKAERESVVDVSRCYAGRLGEMYVYDLDPKASELWAILSPVELSGPIDTDNLPDGVRWLTDDEWRGVLFREGRAVRS